MCAPPWQLWKGKDDDDAEYRYRYDQRQAPGSNRYYGQYPPNASVEARSGYPVNASSDVRGGYAMNADGRSGYPTNSISEVRGGYPVTATADGRSAYPANSIPEVRSGYAVNATADWRSGYPANATTEGRSGYRRPFGQALDDNYVRSSYDSRPEPLGEYRKPYGVSDSSPRGSEYRRPYNEASPRGSEHRRPYAGSADVSPRVEISPRGEYVRTTQQSPREYRKSSGGSVIELMVPMCCAKCKEKVQEELIEVDGVETVRCDPPNSRVIVTGDRFIDIDKCLKKAERAVKNKCELISNLPDDGTGRREKPTTSSGYYEAVERSGILTTPTVSRSSPTGGRSTVMSASPTGGRPILARMPSFASGKVTQYDGVGPRGQDYEAKDFSGFRRMPSFSKHRHNEAEYITSYDQRAEPTSDSRREFSAVRRMPSFNKHRHHDAEYITAADDYSPRTFYEASNAGSSYTSAYNDRPALLSQVSFSKIPVENPNYVKHVSY